MIEKTEAIAVRMEAFSETSRIVTWTTPSHGRITTIIKGSQRPKSAFLGQYDLFYTCELLYYVRDRSGLRIARECAPITMRNRLRTDWKACAIASYASDLTQRVMHEDSPQEEVYTHLADTLDFLQANGSKNGLLPWFEIQLLTLLGLAPRLKTCLGCGKDLLPATGRARFSLSRGGTLCSACAGNSTVDSISIAPDVLAILAGWQRSKTARAAATTVVTPRQADEMNEILGAFLVYHLDMVLPGRSACLDILRRASAGKSLESPQRGS